MAVGHVWDLPLTERLHQGHKEFKCHTCPAGLGWEWARGQVCRLPFPVTTLDTIHTCMRLLSPPHLDGFQLHAKAVVFWQQVPVPGFNLLQLRLQLSFIFSASLLEFSEFLLRVLCPTEFPDVSWSFTERLHAAVIHVSALYSTAFWGRNCHCPHYTYVKMRWLVSRSNKSETELGPAPRCAWLHSPFLTNSLSTHSFHLYFLEPNM